MIESDHPSPRLIETLSAEELKSLSSADLEKVLSELRGELVRHGDTGSDTAKTIKSKYIKALDIENFNNFGMWAEIAEESGDIVPAEITPDTRPCLDELQKLFLAYPEEFKTCRELATLNSELQDRAIERGITPEERLDAAILRLNLRYNLRFFRDKLESDTFDTLNK